MLVAMNEEIARLRGEELRERACRDRQGRIAAAAAGSRRGPSLFRRRRGEALPADDC